MWDYVRIAALGVVTVLAALAAHYARDLAYQAQAVIVMLTAGGLFLRTVRNADEARPAPETGYMDGVVRAGVIATAFWGVVGFLVGVYIAFQLAYPVLNFEWAQGFTNFGRLRPLHTSAVIFAFGGNALIATSFYVVQRTCRGAALAAATSPGSCSGATSCSSCWRRPAICWASPSRANMPSRNGMSISG